VQRAAICGVRVKVNFMAVGEERTPNLRRILIALMVIVLIAVSAGIGLLVANFPQCMRYFAAGH
jgi:hypothetical protein